MFLKNFLCLLQGRPGRTRYKFVLDHDLTDLDVIVFEKLQIPPRQDADELFAVDNRNA